MHMVPTLDDAKKSAEAGADVIVAQGTEGGGHIGLMGTTVIVRQVVKAVAPLPVLAAGGIADGAGLAAALALGAQGVLLGTRFYATTECPAPDAWKQAIVASDGHDTIVTSVPESLTGRDWPGAWSRVLRTRFIEEWLGREPELRRRRGELWSALERAEVRDAVEKFCKYHNYTLAIQFTRSEASSSDPQRMAQIVSQPVVYYRKSDSGKCRDDLSRRKTSCERRFQRWSPPIQFEPDSYLRPRVNNPKAAAEAR